MNKKEYNVEEIYIQKTPSWSPTMVIIAIAILSCFGYVALLLLLLRFYGGIADYLFLAFYFVTMTPTYLVALYANRKLAPVLPLWLGTSAAVLPIAAYIWNVIANPMFSQYGMASSDVLYLLIIFLYTFGGTYLFAGLGKKNIRLTDRP